MSKKTDDKKTVLIAGAGSGTEVARALSTKLDPAKHDIVLVSPLPYKAILPATIRLAVTAEGKLEGRDKAFIPLDKVFQAGRPGRLVIDQVVSIEKSEKGGSALLKSGDRIAFDILVLATGGKWTGPIAFPFNEGEAAVQSFIDSGRQNIKNAKDIVIVGGGAIGIEAAGEITHFYPDKKVTIVHGEDILLNHTYPQKFSRALEARLKARKVELVLNDVVDDFPTGEYDSVKTRSGKVIKADLVLSARGSKPNTDYLISTPLSGSLTSSNLVKVKPTFQVVGHPDVFAIGDIIDWKEQKQAMKASKHAGIASANIISLLTNDGKGLKEYKGSPEMIVVTLGPTGGVAYFGILVSLFGGIVLGDWLARMVKSKDLLVKMLRPSFGQ